MRMFILGASLVFLSAALVYHYAALQAFNALVPKDGDTVLISEAVTYGPDPRQTLDIYAPSNARGPLPILLFVYGGSWKDGNRGGYEFAGRAFAAHGYLTLVMDYRLMPEHRFPAFVQDVALAIAWAEKNGQRFAGDPQRIYAVGHSAGAYNLTLAILDRRYLGAANADATKIRGVATMAGPFNFLPLDTNTTIETFGQEPDLAVTQPITYVRGDVPPFLLMTGTDDQTVKPKNSQSLDRKLREAGAVSELREYQGVGHVGILMALARPFRSKSRSELADILEFFARHRGT